MTEKTRITTDGRPDDRQNEEADIVYFTDRGGNSIKLQQFNGRYYLPFARPADLKGIRNLPMRQDDVLLVTYPRTGTHWLFEMICMLMSGKAKTVKKSKINHQLELATGSDLADLPSPRVLNSHVGFPDLPTQLVEKKVKVVYSFRDPKDVAVSLYKCYLGFPTIWEYSGHFKDFLYLFLEGKVDQNGAFLHYRDTERFLDENPDVPFHIKTYENMSENRVLEVEKLSDFLGLERDDALCREVADKCEFNRMKKDKSDYTVKFDDDNPLYRKGVVGDWRNYFTEEMLEDYYRVYEEKMAGSRFYHLYSRDKFE